MDPFDGPTAPGGHQAATKGFDAGSLLRLQEEQQERHRQGQQSSVSSWIRTDANVPQSQEGVSALPPELRHPAGAAALEGGDTGQVHAPVVGLTGRHAAASRKESDALRRLKRKKGKAARRKAREQSQMQARVASATEQAWLKHRPAGDLRHLGSAGKSQDQLFGFGLQLQGRHVAGSLQANAPYHAMKPKPEASTHAPPSPYRGGPAGFIAGAGGFGGGESGSRVQKHAQGTVASGGRTSSLAPLPMELVLPLSAAPEPSMRATLAGKPELQGHRAAARAQLLRPMLRTKKKKKLEREYREKWGEVEARRKARRAAARLGATIGLSTGTCMDMGMGTGTGMDMGTGTHILFRDRGETGSQGARSAWHHESKEGDRDRDRDRE